MYFLKEVPPCPLDEAIKLDFLRERRYRGP